MGPIPPPFLNGKGKGSAYESVNFQKHCFVSRGLNSSSLGDAGVG